MGGGDRQRQEGRQGDRRARQLRARLAHRHVLQPAAAARLAALRAGSAAGRRQYRLPQHVCRLRDAARRSEARRSRARPASTIPAATRPASCARASRRTHRRPHRRRARCIRWSACIRSPSARRCSSAAGPAPTSTASRVEESEKLLDAVWAHATQERFAWYQKWRIGDLVMWDNRCVMHRRDAFDESLRRLMHRTQIVGEPVLAG